MQTDNFYCQDFAGARTDKPCKEQCFDCMANIGERRLETKQLSGNAEDSPARKAYLNWIAAGKPAFGYYILKT